MIVHWEMSIGYAGAHRNGEVEIDDLNLEGKTEEEIEEIIGNAIWEDAMQYVDVWPTSREK